MDENARKIWDFFKARGLTDEAVAGILGNLQQESGLDPTKKQYGGGKGRGLAQWTVDERYLGVVKKSEKLGLPHYSMLPQLEFMWDELTGSQKHYFRTKANTTFEDFCAMTDIALATEVFEKAYERAGRPMLSTRITYAKQWYNKFKGSGSTFSYDPTNSLNIGSPSNNQEEEKKHEEDGASEEDFYKYFETKFIDVPEELSVAMMDELVKVDPLRRITPLHKYDYIPYGHRYYNSDYNLTLGDCSFTIPPEFMSIASESSGQSLVTLRQESSQKIKSGYSKRTISIDIVLHGNNQINGYKVESPEGFYYADGLRQLLAQFKCTPFLPIENHTINNTYNIHTVALQSIVCSTIEGFPELMTAHLTLQEVDLYPYIESHTMFFSEFIDWDLFRFYYQRQLTETYEHGKLQSIPIDKEKNKFKISILDESVFAYSDKVTTKQPSVYSLLRDERIVRTVQDEDGFDILADSNYVDYIDSSIHDISISSFQGGYSNLLTNIQMAEHAHPTIQYMGGMDTIFNIVFETTDSNVVRLLEECNINNNKLLRDNKDFAAVGFVKLESELVALFGAKYVTIENVITNTVPEFPGLFNVQINCASFDISQWEKEGINGFRPFDRVGTKKDAIEQSPKGLTNKILQDAYVENKLRTDVELYPDLKLPTYQEVDEFIIKLKQFREEKTNIDGDPLGQIEYNLCPRTPQRMLHGITDITGLEIDRNGFVTNLPEFLDGSKWYDGYVDPDFYVFYPETYKALAAYNKEDLEEVGMDLKSNMKKPKARTTTIVRTDFSTGPTTDSNIDSFDTTANRDGSTELQQRFIAAARAKLGKPYSNATSGYNVRTGPNAYDCSGLISRCLMDMGIINAPFATSGIDTLIKAGVFKVKHTVSSTNNMEELMYHAVPGDLFHIYGHERGTKMGHIAIYTGDGKIAHSTSPVSKEGPMYKGFRRVLSVVKLSQSNHSEQNVQQTTNFKVKTDVSFNLSKGSSGTDVKQLQELLNKLDNSGLKVDGKYGELTAQAVKSFQENNNIKIDGIVGPETSLTINDLSNKDLDKSSYKTTIISGKDSEYITKQELEKIARTVANIQLGKPYSAKVALTQLIYDRVMDPKAKYGNLNNILSDVSLFKGEYNKNIDTSDVLMIAENVFCKGERQFESIVVHYSGIESNANILQMDKNHDNLGSIGQFMFWGDKTKKTNEKKFKLTEESEEQLSGETVKEKITLETGVMSMEESFAKFFGKPVVIQTKEIVASGVFKSIMGQQDKGIMKDKLLDFKGTTFEGLFKDAIGANGPTFIGVPIMQGTSSGDGLTNMEGRYRKNFNTPEQILMTSFVNQCEYSAKGRLLKAFPTYSFSIVDEDGQWLDGRKLWANYYTLRSLVDIQVVNYNDSPVNTATITVTNSYGNLDKLPANLTYYNPGDDVGYAKWQRGLYNTFGILPSFGPKLTDELVERKNVIFDSMVIRAGCRVHLRMGYGSDPLSLPVVLNGFISDLSVGDITTFVCVSDGVELTNSVISDKPNDVNGIFSSQESSNITMDVLTKRQSGMMNALNQKWGEPSKYGIEHFGLYFTKKVDIGEWSKDDLFGLDGPAADKLVNFLNSQFNMLETILTPGALMLDGLIPGLKTVQYDLVKNIYRSSYEGSLAMYKKFIGFADGEKNLCFSQYNKTPWDAIQMGVQNAPEYIGMPFYHQFESRMFLGLPYYLIKYRYNVLGNYIFEEAKTYAQAHFIDSLTEIIDNQMICTSRDVYTNAVVMYTLGKSPKASPTLFSDKSIDFSKHSTKIFDSSITQNFIGPDKLWYLLGLKQGKNGACRVGTSQLLYNWEKAYQGDIILLGDAGIEPNDYLYINDRFNELTGLSTARTVTHSLSAQTGFITTVTPSMVGFSTMQNSQAQVITTNIMSIGAAFSYNMAMKKIAKDNAESVAEWYNTSKALTNLLLTGGTQFAYKLASGIYIGSQVKKLGSFLLAAPLDFKTYMTAMKVAGAGAQIIQGFKFFASDMRKVISLGKMLKNSGRFGTVVMMVKDTFTAGKTLFTGIKSTLTVAGMLSGPIGAVVRIAITLVVNLLLDKVIDYFKYNNVVVLLPLMHKEAAFAPITSGKKLLITQENTGNGNVEETSTGKGDPGAEENMSEIDDEE